jgi:hypothetical protein
MLNPKFVRAILLLMFINFIVGCNRNEKVKPIYKSIELSYSNGWNHAFSLEINSNNIVRKCEYKIKKGLDSTVCYVDTVSEASIDSLNYFVSRLNIERPDTLYDDMCEDCDWYIIRVKQDNKQIESKVEGDRHQKLLVDSLAQFIFKRSFGMNHKVDTTYYFKFKEEIFPPPPPMPIRN